MNIKGNFEVDLFNQKTFEKQTYKGENLITNIGKKYLSQWLMHSVFSNSLDKEILINSTDSEQLETTAEIVAKSYWTNQNLSGYCASKQPQNCLNNDGSYSIIYNSSYNFNNSNTYFRRESSIYFDFNDYKKLKKIIMKANCCDINGNDYYQYGCYLEIATSDFPSDDNKNWKVRKYVRVSKGWNLIYNETKSKYEYDTTNASDLVIYLGDRNDPEMAVKNVKSIRITPYYYGMKIYNVAFFEENDYPSPPCVIGLGTGKTEPTVKDTDLTQKITLLLATCTQTLDEFGNPTIEYRTKLGIRECNGNVFSEIGLFCVKDGVLPYRGQKVELFSHGLFETSWEKNSDVIADIRYFLSPSEKTNSIENTENNGE